MQVNQADIIRFLMDEMDPSEKISFEQKIRLDQDLLIEVESLKKTWQKTNAYPSFKSPEHVKEAIFTKAEESINTSRKNWNWQWMQQHSFKIAASFLVMATALVAWNTWIPASQTESTSSSNTPIDVQQSNAPLTTTKDSGKGNGVNQIDDEITPWVDNNHIIRFAGTTEFNLSQSPGINSTDQQNSKLRLVNDQTGYTGQSRKILLTGNTP
jgi:hypothetical protein